MSASRRKSQGLQASSGRISEIPRGVQRGRSVQAGPLERAIPLARLEMFSLSLYAIAATSEPNILTNLKWGRSLNVAVAWRRKCL